MKTICGSDSAPICLFQMLVHARASGTIESSSGGLSLKVVRLIGHSGPIFGFDVSKCGRYLMSCNNHTWISLNDKIVGY